MTPERATEIIHEAQSITTIGPWSDQLDRIMKPGERAAVVAVWKKMPGYTCFVDALFQIARGRTP